jgi:hypothetical protein
MMTVFSCFLQLLIGFIGAAYLMPSPDAFKNETHTFRWSTGPDLNDTLCATATPQLYHENSSAEVTALYRRSGE